MTEIFFFFFQMNLQSLLDDDLVKLTLEHSWCNLINLSLHNMLVEFKTLATPFFSLKL